MSHGTIYLTIYAYPRGELKRQLIGYLRQGKGKRRTRSPSSTGREQSLGRGHDGGAHEPVVMPAKLDAPTADAALEAVGRKYSSAV